MQTFTTTLSSGEYTEILQGGDYVAFDIEASVDVRIVLTETADAPAIDTPSNKVSSWSEGWDFEGSGFVVNVQRVWVMGSGDIVGVRG